MLIYVLCHTAGRLAVAPDAPHIRKVDLTQLDANNDLAESRFFHHQPVVPDTYIGLATWRWDQKYTCLRLADLPTLACSPNVVWCADLADANWPAQSEGFHKGMSVILDELGAQNNPAPWSNNFVAHCDIIRGLASFHQQQWPLIVKRWGAYPPYHTPPDGRHGSYLAERLSMIYLQRFECRQIPRA